MTLFWCALALVQVAFLPGYLAARALRLDEGAARTWALSFVFSLVANYHVTLGLTILGAYDRTVLFGLIAGEVVALAWMLRTPRARPARSPASAPLTRFLCPHGPAAGVAPARALLLLAGVVPLLQLAARVPEAFTTVFTSYDALVSYNRWALDWAEGLLPAWTMHYPQLLPAAWSMLYVIAGADLQFLAKGLSILFPITTLWLLIDLGLHKGRPRFLIAALITGALSAHTGGRFVASGFPDLPVAFFALAAYHTLVRSGLGTDARSLRRRVAAATVCVAGAALTKQAGIFLACVFPLLLALRLRRPAIAQAGVRVPRTVAAVVVALVLFIAPWNVYKEIQVQRGFEAQEQAASAGVHGGRSLPERLAWSWAIWESELSAPGLAAVVVAVGVSLVARRGLPWTLGVALPYTLLWALYFSYDRRNLSLAFPFLGISAGIGAELVGHRVAQRWRGLSPSGRRRSGAATLALLALTVFWAVDTDPHSAHDRGLRALGKADLNAFLYAYHEQHGFEGRILTNYRVLSVLPDLRDHVYFDRDAPADEFWPFRDPEAFRRVLERERAQLRYIVLLKPADWAIQRLIVDGIRRGELQALYRTHAGIVVRIPPEN